jgi:perosamine synthetase
MGKKYGKLELKYVTEALESDNLFYFGGKKTEKLLERIKSYFGVRYSSVMSSGTAAIHCAVAALEIPPGNEIITSAITDMGTVIGILYQNLIPVFADVDPHTYNITAESIKKVLTPKTKALIVVHLAANSAEMDQILTLAKEHNIYVIEDCAQAYGAKYKGKYVGTLGDMGCYSLNAYKHISAGDGGFVITNNEEYQSKLTNYADKYYDRTNKSNRLKGLGLNYRITELQSAVALAQFEKLSDITTKRHIAGDKFNLGIKNLEGIFPHQINPNNYCTYWFTMIRFDPKIVGCSREDYVEALKKEGLNASAGYIEKPLYLEPVFVSKNFFPGNIWPAEVVSGKNYTYHEGMCPVAEEVLKTAIRMPIDEFMDDKEIEKMISGFKKAYEKCRKK